MSLPLERNSTEPDPAKAARYRALSPLAVASAILGVLSIATALSWSLAIIPLAGIVAGWQAQRRIREAPDEWTGLRVAQVGIALSLAFWMLGYGRLIFARGSEIPFGYTRITYEMLQPDPMKPTEPIPQSAMDMRDKKVYMTGYMMPSRRQTGIKEFVLMPTNGECPFCTPTPKPTEKIRVMLQGDTEAVFTTHLVHVAGRFRVDPDDPSGVPYALDADYFR